jgi:hypothetical protein
MTALTIARHQPRCAMQAGFFIFFNHTESEVSKFSDRRIRLLRDAGIEKIIAYSFGAAFFCLGAKQQPH